MAVAARDRFMEASQRPTRRSMIKRRGFGLAFAPMTSPTPVRIQHVVAFGARRVVLFQCSLSLNVLFPLLVTAHAVVLVMAFNACQTEAVDMFSMPKQHLRSCSVVPPPLGAIKLGIRLWNRWVHHAHDVVARRNALRALGRTAGLRKMTDATRCFVTPFAVAIQTLPVVRTFQPRPADVLSGRADLVAGLTGRVGGTFRCVVMADGAADGHLRHLRVTFVVKGNRKVTLFQLAE